METRSQNRGGVYEGARLVWRHQRLLWWLFIANLVLAALGTLTPWIRIHGVADHSLYAQRLSQGFDLAAFFELAENPGVNLGSNFSGSLAVSAIFAVFVLFLNGGILETYWGDRKLSTSEFFGACGLYFWRWVRLLVFMLILLVPIFTLAGSILSRAGRLMSDAAQEKRGYWVAFAGLALILLLMLAVRLWFDMAQLHAVGESERRMRVSLLRAFRLTIRRFGSLFWMYFRITLLGDLGVVLAMYLWMKLPDGRIGTGFTLMEVVLLWCLAIRLWQRASVTIWYQRNAGSAESLPAVAAVVPFSDPLPQS